jgi:predicted dehydrogenase
MIKVGITGIGFMGMIHYLSYQKLRGVKVVAMCELDAKRLKGDWRGIQGNFGPPGKKMDLSGIATYQNFDEMLANDKIDVVDVTLPPGLHSQTACHALKAGKHVFCEKPMALTPKECDKMVRAADKANRQLMVGHVLPFLPEYAWAYKVVQSGKYGQLLGGHFRRVISDPAWLTHYWDEHRIGGPMLDLHVHDAHFIRLLFGMPVSLTTSGRLRGNLAEFWNTNFRFPDPNIVVQATSGTINQQGRPFNHGFEIHLEEATLQFEFAVLGKEAKYLCVPTLLDRKGKVHQAKMPTGDPMMNAFSAELKAVAQSIKTGIPNPILNATLARDAIKICNMQTQSLRKRRKA